MACAGRPRMAYLKPALARANLKVETRALIRRILLEGKKAVGVEYERGGKIMTARASREVLLCAGPIGSPQLLQRSGIGPAAVLKNAGVEVIHDLPGVGENLQDHLEFYFQFQCKQPITLNAKLNWWSKFWIGARWYFFKSGLGITNHFESCAVHPLASRHCGTGHSIPLPARRHALRWSSGV